MNRRVLVVDERADSLEEIRRLLSERFDAHTAQSLDAALEVCEHHSPFATIITTDASVLDPTEELARLQKGWPDTPRILLSSRPDLDLVVKALNGGAVFRLLREPVRKEDLLCAVEESVDRFGRIEEERLFTEQLQFCRESLLELTETLEQRLADQIGRMRCLQRLSSELNDAGSLEGMAEIAADTTAKLIGKRSVLVLLEDPARHRQVEHRTSGHLSFRVHNEPVRSGDGEIGLIQIDECSVDGKHLSDADRGILRSIAGSLASAVYNHIFRHSKELAHHATIHALSRLAENRDDETARHLERVSAYCRLIAEGLRDAGHHTEVLTGEYIQNLVLSAPLHDIGKVGIPDAILLKPGPLTEQEWAVMKKHPTIGAETIHHVIARTGEQAFLRMGLEIAWCHHERWDGCGYPRGLEGEEIPLCARIMALADVYDALTSLRPYKLPWSHTEAVTYVLEERGGHFDPRIADVFARQADRFDEVRARLADAADDLKTLATTAKELRGSLTGS